MEHKSVVQIVSLDSTGDSKYRMEWPAIELAAKKPNWKILNIEANHPDRYNYALNSDLLVLFNPADIGMLSILEKRNKNSLPTVVEFNDNFYEPQKWSPVSKEWSSWEVHSIYELFLINASHIITTSKNLKDIFSKTTKADISILDNFIPAHQKSLEELLGIKHQDSIGWAGSLGHIADVIAFSNVFRKFIEYNSNYNFHIMGNVALPDVTNLNPNRVKFTNWGGIDFYYEFLSSLKIGVIPLLNTSYNQCRSDIKVLEMAYWGVLPIVPKMEPYLTLVNDFKLPSYTDHQSLFNAIIATVKLNQDERKKIIHPLYEWISNNRIHSKDNSRVNLYSNLLQNCPQKSDFFEDRNCGYNYLDKKENTEYSFINEIKNINKLIELNQIQQAHLQTLKMLEDNPLNPKVTLYYLNLIKKLKFPHDKEYLVLIKTTFQKDIQIQLNIIELNDTEDSKLESLYELISLIRLQCENYQKSVREILANYLIALIKSSNQKYVERVLNICEEFLILNQFSFNLRLAMAEKYRQLSRIKEARTHFSALNLAKSQYLSGLKEIADIDYGYISAWFEGLDKQFKSNL